MSSSEGNSGAIPASSAPGKRQESHPYRALFRKTATLQKRQKRTNCCQICFPVTMVVLIGLLQLVVNATTDDLGKKKTVRPSVVDPLKSGDLYGRKIVYSGEEYVGTYDTHTGQGTKYLAHVKRAVYNATGQLPEFDAKSDSNVVDDYTFGKLQSAYKNRGLFTKLKRSDNLLLQIPFSGWNVYNVTGDDLQYAILVNNNTELRFCDNKMIGVPDPDTLTGFGVPLLGDGCAVQTAVSSMDLIHSAVGNAWSSNEDWHVRTKVKAMPFKYRIRAAAVAELLGIFFFPLIAMFMLPVFLYVIVMEKQAKLREMMKMHGMRMRYYWATIFGFSYAMFIVSTVLFFAICALFQFRFVLQTSFILYTSLYLVWGMALVSLTVFMSALVHKGSTATVVGYALVLILGITAPILELFIWGDTTERPFVYMMFPPYAFCHGLIYLLLRCVQYRCVKMDNISGSSDPFVVSIIYLLIAIPLYLILGMYLDLVVPSGVGIPKHPLFFLPRFNEKKRRKKDDVFKAMLVDEEEPLVGESSGELPLEEETTKDPLFERDVAGLEEEDEDVFNERRKVESGERNPENSAVLVSKLKKVYKSGKGEKIAIRNLTLSMAHGSCFGLLGPNGAGKTTIISILCGLFPPSQGAGYVNGFDIRTQTSKIHLTMGVCPQFDTLWEDLSSREHLLFYARLKGCEPAHEKMIVENMLRKVGLEGESGLRPAKNLSGGMKRRLSIAIALIGDPQVVFLDEPTTGLDPTTRRHLWGIIEEAKPGKCIVLTTHAMDEADTLCDRIGIMSLGYLRCIGTQLHLKTRFGQGYRLALSFEDGKDEDGLSWILSLVPSARVTHSFAGTAVLELPKKDVRLSQLVAQLEKGKGEHGIRDWGVSQTSLEDVFLEIVRRDEGELTPADE